MFIFQYFAGRKFSNCNIKKYLLRNYYRKNDESVRFEDGTLVCGIFTNKILSLHV